jgi:hypothetical protein
MIARSVAASTPGEGLVQQIEVGILRQCARQKHTLLLPAGKLADLAVREVGHADAVEAGPCVCQCDFWSRRAGRACGKAPSGQRRSRWSGKSQSTLAR